MKRHLLLSTLRVSFAIAAVFLFCTFLYGIWAYRIEPLNIYIYKAVVSGIALLTLPVAFTFLKHLLTRSGESG
jgi:hypothetical protein